VVRLLKVEDGVLHVENVDILDGTPLLDIKPCAPEFGRPAEIRTGWLKTAKKRASKTKSDGRFG